MDIVNSEYQWFELRKRLRNKDFDSCICKNSRILKDIIFELVINDIPFHKINYGLGVYKIIRNGIICEHCLGKGIIKGE